MKAGQLIMGDISMSLSKRCIEKNLKESKRNIGFVYINRAKLDEIKDHASAEPLIRQFKQTALGLN